ncbi:MAG TPA: biosynthetic-type acetolactate synthase large subunit [Clostridia bacterium]|nr:biosynthetic-type acetolactate synthase large subunit [Clostridia bacterium]
MKMVGAEIVIRCLMEQGVSEIFGYPGGAALNIYDALYKNSDKITHYSTAHEQGAAHAADGYSRATGKVGVCMSTSGPGATNLVTGIATAYMDSVPLVAITANVPLSLLGKDSFQEVDVVGITMPITKHNFIVKDVNELAATIRRAFYIAREGRPGPVLIDIPKDITAQMAEYSYEEPKPVRDIIETIKEEDILDAAKLIEKSEKPLVYVGGGAVRSGASEGIRKFVQKVQAPVASSLMGLGAFPSTDELFTGMLGMHGTKASNVAATRCDLLIGIGVRFSDRATGNVDNFAPDAEILQIDIDPAEINKNVATDHFIIGAINKVIPMLNEKIKQKDNTPWLKQIAGIKREYPLTYKKDDGLKPQYIVEKVKEVAGERAIIATEVGQNQIWTAQFYKFTEPRTFLTSGGLGTMGYGIGASMGAQIAMPDKQVFNIAGDGSFHMNCNELSTAVKYNIPIIIVVLNNQVLGMVRQWQSLFYDKRYSSTTLEKATNIVKLAEAFGATGFSVTKNEEIEDTLRRAMDVKGPVVIDCRIDRDEMVLPIVPPGKNIEDLVME